jgi:hypothetical protein
VAVDLWLDDISRLRGVAETHLLAVGADLDASLAILHGLTASGGAFGGVEEAPALGRAYERLRALLEDNTRAAGDRVHEVAVALRVIADTYEDAERRNDPTR